MNTIERARNRWREILPQMGIATGFLQNRHGPCPLCGGKDRFRFDDRDGTGSYFCNQCGPGPGLLLVQKLHKWNFATACTEIDKIIGNEAPAPRSEPRSDDRADRLAACEKILGEACAPDIVGRYLHGRSLSVIPPVLQGHSRLAYVEAGRYVGRYPAMLAPITGPEGELQSVHRTFLADLPTRKKIMPPVETIRGAAVRLFDPVDSLGVAEGIETAIAARELFDVPTWAALSTSGLKTFRPPDDIRRLIIFGDNDSIFAGQTAAYTLANRLARETSLDIEVNIPPGQPGDWLDVLNRRRAA